MPAPRHEWNGPTLKIHTGNYPPSVFFQLDKTGNITAFASGTLPKSTTIEIFGKKHPLPQNPKEKIKVPVCDRLGGISFEKDIHPDMLRASSKVDLGLEVSVKLPRYKTLKAKAPPLIIVETDGACLSQVKSGPLLFAGEKGEDPTEPYSAAYVNSTNYVWMIGEAKRLADVDIVVLNELVDTGRTHTCSYTSRDITMHIYNTKLTAYERRTGKALTGATTFPGRTTCPTTVLVNDDQKDMGSGVDTEQVISWVKGQLRSYSATAKMHKPKG